MRLRRLQRKDEEGWYDDAYAFEDDADEVIFRYNLTWERIGSRYNGKLRESRVSLAEIETVIEPNEGLRWLPIEVIAEEEVESFLAALDETCAIPKPRPIALTLTI
jgi:hypothetical protein